MPRRMPHTSISNMQGNLRTRSNANALSNDTTKPKTRICHHTYTIHAP